MFINKKRKWSWGNLGKIIIAVVISVCVTIVGMNFTIQRDNDVIKFCFKVGNPLDAYTGNVDFVGTNSTAVKNALYALPTTGGEIQLVSASYTFTETLSRAINNVTIKGNNGTTITYAGACFSVGAQTGWKFEDLTIAVGGSITNGTNACYENVTVGATYYTYRAPNTVGNISAPSIADSSLSSNRIVLSGAGGTLGSLGAGTSGQVLYSAGAGVDPAWGDNAGGVNGVYVDATLGTAGGTGTPDDPTDTIAHAITLATANNYTRYYLGPGDYTMPAGAVSNMHIMGQAAGGIYPSTNVSMNGCAIGDAIVIERCGVDGSWTTPGATCVRFVQSSFNQNTGTDMGDKLAAYDCLIDNICISTSGWLYNCHGETGTFQTNNTAGNFYFVNYSGFLQLTSFTNTTPSRIYFWSSDAKVYIAASCTYLYFYSYGFTNITNASTSTNVDIINDNYGSKLIQTTIDLNQAANTYDLFTVPFGSSVIVKAVNIKTPTGAVGGALTSISIQTNHATPYTFIDTTKGAVANLTSEANLSWTSGGEICLVDSQKKIQLTINGGAAGVSKICIVTVEYISINGGTL